MKKTKTKKRRFSKGEISDNRMTPAQRRAWQREAERIIQRNQAQQGDQHTRCDYCGRTYLITEHTRAGSGCLPCLSVVTALPQPAKVIIDAVVYRLKALEDLRQAMENDLNRSTEVRKARRKRLVALERARKYGRR